MILTVGLQVEDQQVLLAIFHKSQRAVFAHARNLEEAKIFIKTAGDHAIRLIIAERKLADGTWKDLRKLSPESLIIVADCHANNEMWGKVLQNGGHDLQHSRPFDKKAIEHAVLAAWYHSLQIRP